MLKCFHCNTDIKITWKAWWRMTVGVIVCPSCKSVSGYEVKPRMLRYFLNIWQLLPFILLGLAWGEVLSFIWVGPAFLVTVLCDKFLRERYAVLSEFSAP